MSDAEQYEDFGSWSAQMQSLCAGLYERFYEHPELRRPTDEELKDMTETASRILGLVSLYGRQEAA